MNHRPLEIAGAFAVSLPTGLDERGRGVELFHVGRWEDLIGREFGVAQTSLLHNNKGTLRGLHLAEGGLQSKLITCVSGQIWDVLVDFRPDSPSHGIHAVIEMSGTDPTSVFCPPGVAHGFVCMSNDALVTLTVDVPFESVPERAIAAFDPELGISWPVSEADCVRSERDRNALPCTPG